MNPETKIVGRTHCAAGEERLFAFFVYAPLLLHLILAAQDVLGIASAAVNFLLYTLFYGLPFALLALKAAKEKRLVVPIAVLLCYVVALALGLWFTPGVESLVVDGAPLIVLRLVWAFYIGFYLLEPRRFSMILAKWSWIALLYCGICILFQDQLSVNYLTMSDDVFLPALGCFAALFFYKDKEALVIGIALMCLIGIFGSRRHALEMLVAVVFLLVFRPGKRDARAVVLIPCAMILAGALAFMWQEEIFEILGSQFPGSRSVQLLLSGAFFESDIRSEGYQYLLGVVASDPLSIRGAFADNIIWGNVFADYYNAIYPGANYAVSDFSGTYAHSLYIELLVQYGVLFGGALLLGFLTLNAIVLVRIARRRVASETMLATLFILPGLVASFAGGNYLSDVTIMFALGSLFSVFRMRRVERTSLEPRSCAKSADGASNWVGRFNQEEKL